MGEETSITGEEMLEERGEGRKWKGFAVRRPVI